MRVFKQQVLLLIAIFVNWPFDSMSNSNKGITDEKDYSSHENFGADVARLMRETADPSPDVVLVNSRSPSPPVQQAQPAVMPAAAANDDDNDASDNAAALLLAGAQNRAEREDREAREARVNSRSRSPSPSPDSPPPMSSPSVLWDSFPPSPTPSNASETPSPVNRIYIGDSEDSSMEF